MWMSQTERRSWTAHLQHIFRHRNMNSRDGDFSYADAESPAERLLERSRRSISRFFKQEKQRRPLRFRRNSTDGCLVKDGMEPPVGIHDMLFLSGCPSTKSMGGHGRTGLGASVSNVSLALTCSTTADTNAGPLTPSQDSSDHGIDVEKTDISKLQAIPRQSDPLSPLPQHSGRFSIGASLIQAKKWGHIKLKEMKPYLRRPKIRSGKEPALEVECFPQDTPTGIFEIPKELLEIEFKKPSSSKQFQHLNLEGGVRPPKFCKKPWINWITVRK